MCLNQRSKRASQVKRTCADKLCTSTLCIDSRPRMVEGGSGGGGLRASCKQHIFWFTSANVTRRLYLEFRMRPSYHPSTTLFSIPLSTMHRITPGWNGEEWSSQREDREDRDSRTRRLEIKFARYWLVMLPICVL